ncbi:hypothetical protein ElyMa_002449100 [Elysia marginata]|uniref:Uncharacterized protein n=1 Tax=Elysia marginata TaxID=1093978 RepID=A0AAV4GJX9_9GAST|nr:hypothetical protein ElyMa_002449100 [Elysia marginata]
MMKMMKHHVPSVNPAAAAAAAAAGPRTIAAAAAHLAACQASPLSFSANTTWTCGVTSRAAKRVNFLKLFMLISFTESVGWGGGGDVKKKENTYT